MHLEFFATEPLETLKQMLLIVSGVAVIALVHLALEP